MQPERFTLVWKTAEDREIFTLQTIRVKIFALLNFAVSFAPQNFVTVDDYNMNVRLESS